MLADKYEAIIYNELANEYEKNTLSEKSMCSTYFPSEPRADPR